MVFTKSNLPILDCRSLTMAQGVGHVNESLDLSDEKYEQQRIPDGGESEAKLSEAGGRGRNSFGTFAIAVRPKDEDNGFEDLERTPNTFTDAIEKAQVCSNGILSTMQDLTSPSRQSYVQCDFNS